MNTMTETRRVYTDAEIKAGDPCTFYTGSDSYAETVSAVIRYKSGTRKGQIKEIHIRANDWNGPTIFRPATCHNGRVEYLLVREGRKQWYGALVVGYAKDYLDPHF
jgi:hypothetical protein